MKKRSTMNSYTCEELAAFPTRNPLTNRYIDPMLTGSTYERLGLQCYKYGYDLVPCKYSDMVRNPRTKRCRSKSPRRRSGRRVELVVLED